MSLQEDQAWEPEARVWFLPTSRRVTLSSGRVRGETEGGGDPDPPTVLQVSPDLHSSNLNLTFYSYVIRFGKCKGKSCGKERFFFNALNVSIYENDIAILKLESPQLLQCEEGKIWPACLPNGVTLVFIWSMRDSWYWAELWIRRLGEDHHIRLGENHGGRWLVQISQTSQDSNRIRFRMHQKCEAEYFISHQTWIFVCFSCSGSETLQQTCPGSHSRSTGSSCVQGRPLLAREGGARGTLEVP